MTTARLPVVVFAEGQSDVAALDVLLRSRGIDPDTAGVELIDMGGVTNIRRRLDDVAATQAARRVLGLCDAREAPYVVRALAANGVAIANPADLASFGFHVCDTDLEDELIRALGPARVLEVIEGLGLAKAFAQFSQQPAWAGRPLHARLQRFAGVASGRKTVLAAALAAAAAVEQIPAPLRLLVRQIETALAGSDGPVIAPFPGLSR